MEPVVRVGVWAGEQVNCSKFHTIEWFLSAFEINVINEVAYFMAAMPDTSPNQPQPQNTNP